MKFSIKDFFSKCDQIRSIMRIWSHLLNKSLMENFTFCAVYPFAVPLVVEEFPCWRKMDIHFYSQNKQKWLSQSNQTRTNSDNQNCSHLLEKKVLHRNKIYNFTLFISVWNFIVTNWNFSEDQKYPGIGIDTHTCGCPGFVEQKIEFVYKVVHEEGSRNLLQFIEHFAFDWLQWNFAVYFAYIKKCKIY